VFLAELGRDAVRKQDLEHQPAHGLALEGGKVHIVDLFDVWDQRR
jgi:hypothetical protein